MSKLDLFKYTLQFFASASVGAVVKNMVNHSMPVKQSVPTQILTGVGTFLITTVVGDQCTEYVEKKILKFE